MKKLVLFFTIILTFGVGTLLATTWTYDFGTNTGAVTTATSVTNPAYLPTPTSGSAYLRVGSGAGSVNAENPGLSSLGSGTELRIVAPTGASLNKYDLYSYTGGKAFYTKFSVLMGNSSGAATATSGKFTFAQGAGTTYNSAVAYTANQTFTGLQWTFGAAGALTTNYLSASTWTALGSTPCAQGNVYTVEIYGNNTTALITYSYAGNTNTVAANKQDIWINGTLIGNDLAKGTMAADTNVDSYMFYGESSTANVANMFLDDFTYSNDITVAAVPTITVTGAFSAFSTTVGTPSAAQSVSITGTNLTANVDVSAVSGYEYSSASTGPWTSTLSVAVPFTCYARLTGATVGSPAGTVSFTSAGATQIDKAVSGTVNPLTPVLTVTGTFSAFSTTTGTPSASQNVAVTGSNLTGNVSVSAVAGYEYSTNDAAPWTSTLSVAAPFTCYVRLTGVSAGSPSGTISFTSLGATQVDKTVSGTVTAPTPLINVVGTFTAFSTTVGTPSTSQSVTVSGTNLTANIDVSAVSGYEYSTTNAAPWTSTLSITSGTVYVRLTGVSLGTYSGTISFTSAGATQVDKAVSGSVTAVPTPMNIQLGSTLITDFDGIGASATASLPQDWKADKNATARLVGSYSAAVSATERSDGNNLSATAGNGIYNYGAGPGATATDRCIGFLSSSSATKSGNVYVKLTNTGSSTITALGISYNVEKYRTGTNAAGYMVQMYYSADGVAWSSAGPDFLSSWAADGTTLGYANAPGDTKTANSDLPLTLAASGVVYLAWNYSVTSGTTTSYAQALGIDDVSITGKQLDIVAVPTFDTVPGIIYTSTKDIYLNCATAGATIRYTLDGSAPSSTVGTIYTTGPITLSSTTTIKAIAYKSGWEDSAIASATYTFPINVANIAALRSGTVGTTAYRLTGEAILTLQSTVTASKNKYIQDATGAIQIYDPTPYKMTTSYNLGDGITGIVGTLTLYGNMLEFVPVTDAGAATHTSGFVPTPVNVTLAALDTSYQAKLIHITDVTIDPAAVSPFAASTNYVISDPSGAGVLRTAYADLDYIGAAFTTSPMNYTGVCLQYLTAYQLVPRSLTDITVAVTTVPITVTSNILGAKIYRNTIETVYTTPHIFDETLADNVTYGVQDIATQVTPTPQTITISTPQTVTLNYTNPPETTGGGAGSGADVVANGGSINITTSGVTVTGTSGAAGLLVVTKVTPAAKGTYHGYLHVSTVYQVWASDTAMLNGGTLAFEYSPTTPNYVAIHWGGVNNGYYPVDQPETPGVPTPGYAFNGAVSAYGYNLGNAPFTSASYTGGILTVGPIPSFTAKSSGTFEVILNGGDFDLPVELSSFTATSATSELLVTLQWTTESETNNLGFNILRSPNANIEYAISLNHQMITGTNSSTQHTYVFADDTVEAPNTYYYWLENIDFSGLTKLNGPVMVNVLDQGDPDTPPVIPTNVTKLNNAYPNPFNPETNISFDLKEPGFVTITIYDIKGQRVKILSAREWNAGRHHLVWDGQDESGRGVGSGVYFFQMNAGKYHSTQKVVLMK